jgi:hypothetical protein
MAPSQKDEVARPDWLDWVPSLTPSTTVATERSVFKILAFFIQYGCAFREDDPLIVPEGRTGGPMHKAPERQEEYASIFYTWLARHYSSTRATDITPHPCIPGSPCRAVIHDKDSGGK